MARAHTHALSGSIDTLPQQLESIAKDQQLSKGLFLINALTTVPPLNNNKINKTDIIQTIMGVGLEAGGLGALSTIDVAAIAPTETPNETSLLSQLNTINELELQLAKQSDEKKLLLRLNFCARHPDSDLFKRGMNKKDTISHLLSTYTDYLNHLEMKADIPLTSTINRRSAHDQNYRNN